MNLKKNKMIKIALLTSMISITILGGYSKLNKEVTLIVNGEEKQISTFKYLKKNKMIKIALLTSMISITILGGYSKLNKEVTLIVNGEEKQISTFKSDVQDLLVAEGVKYDKNDIVTKDLDEKLNDGMEIEVINVTEEVIKESKSVPFEVNVVEDKDLLKGQTKVGTN